MEKYSSIDRFLVACGEVVPQKFDEEQKIRFLMEKLKSNSPAEPCPKSEKVIAFAFNELEAGEKRKIFSHLLVCNDCFELWEDVHEAEKEVTGESIKMPPKLIEAIKAMRGKRKWPDIHFLEKWLNKPVKLTGEKK